MSSLDDTDARAAGAMKLATMRLAWTYPFHAGLVACGRVEADEAVESSGVTIRDAGIRFLYAPAFVVRHSLDQLVGLLHHLVNHLLFEHLFADPRRYPDHDCLLIAQEVTANEFVKEPLPGEPLTLARFPDLPPHEDTDARYRRLTRRGGDRRLSGCATGPGRANRAQGPSETGRESTWSGRKSAQKDRKSSRMPPKTTQSGTKSVPFGPGPGAPGGGMVRQPQSLDDHSIWAEARAAGPLGPAIVRTAVRRAAAALSSEQWEAIAPQLRAQIARTGWGEGAGGTIEELLSADRTGAVDWRRQLRQFVSRAVERTPVYNRPNRRFPALVGVIPGRFRRPARARVLAVVDTSGSISTKDLAAIDAELWHMSRYHEIEIVECDAMIQAQYPYRGRLEEVRGRGGTDLRVPFRRMILNRVRPDVVVVFSDGRGPAPNRSPGLPVIWCLVAGGSPPAHWGKVVHIRPKMVKAFPAAVGQRWAHCIKADGMRI
jgi:predicted metal-dependent peptidase